MIELPPFPFRFDGHGVNDANGERLVKVTSIKQYSDDGKTVNERFRQLSILFARAPEMYLVLKKFVDDVPCRFDHEGYCQNHYITNPCEVGQARDIISEIEGDR